jgi:hypothetical protein
MKTVYDMQKCILKQVMNKIKWQVRNHFYRANPAIKYGLKFEQVSAVWDSLSPKNKNV